MRGQVPALPNPADLRIGIVGAGCAGLTAAEELRHRGYSRVTVLESKKRAGGKVITGWHIGVQQSVREIPGLLAFTAIFLLMLMREQTLAIVDLDPTSPFANRVVLRLGGKS